MKKIALIMDGWKRFFTYAWPAGVLERIRETNEDVNLYIFNSSGDWSRDEDYNIGEYNIYRLPDLNDFDGIIVDLNNIRYSEVREYVISSAKATGKPVISIANEIADFYYVGIDNYSAMQEIAAHLYEVHNCRRFWYVMGPDDNYESNRRVAALRDFSETHGILWMPGISTARVMNTSVECMDLKNCSRCTGNFRMPLSVPTITSPSACVRQRQPTVTRHPTIFW